MADLEVHLLDPGAIEYGDCVLCLADGRSILVDGGKKASSRPGQSRVSGRDIFHVPIQEQIEAITGTTDVDLLIVTHCHSDHVGSLPKLLRDGVINCSFALIADPQFGFGITGDAAEPGPASSMTPAEKLWMAMREEPVHSNDDRKILEFIEDAAAEYEEYVGMVKFLREKLGSNCVIYRGPKESDSAGLTQLLSEFSGTGLKIFGPSFEQLGNCALFLTGRSEDVAELTGTLTRAGTVDLVAAYREQVRLMQSADAEDAGANGNAVNNQSLVFSVGNGAQRALLTGDMQFTKPQLDNDEVKAEMRKLKDAISQDVSDHGFFGFLKLSHHGATNGQDKELLTKWGGNFFGISTGSESSKHPTAPTLAALKALKDEFANLRWGRTDMNGRVTYTATGQTLKMLKERGRWSDLTPPAARTGDAGPGEEEAIAAPAPAPVSTTARLERSADGNVELILRLPYAKTKINLSLTIEPGDAGPL